MEGIIFRIEIESKMNRPTESRAKTVAHAKKFFQDVKERFHDQPEKFDMFRLVVQDIAPQRTISDGKMVTQEKVPKDKLDAIKAILEGHDDLISRFRSFLPRQWLADSIQEENEAETASEGENSGLEEAINFTNKVRMRDRQLCETFLDIYKDHITRGSNGGVVDFCNEAVQLFSRHPNLLEDFYRFISVFEATPPLPYSPPSSQSSDVSNSRETVEITDWGQRKNKRMKLYERNDKHRMKAESSGGAYDNREMEKINTQGRDFFVLVRQKLSSPETYHGLLKLFYHYSSEKLGKDELETGVSALIEEYPDAMEKFKLFLGNCENFYDLPTKAENRQEDDRKGKEREPRKKSIRDLDLSNLEKCTPSYRILPKEYHVCPVPKKHDDQTHILNYQYVSVVEETTKDETTYRQRRPNPDQQQRAQQFDIEDKRYELDMFLGWLNSAIEYGQAILEGTDIGEIEKQQGRLHIKRCVERLYGDHGLDVISILKKDCQWLPVVLDRLIKKYEEFRHFHLNFSSIFIE